MKTLTLAGLAASISFSCSGVEFSEDPTEGPVDASTTPSSDATLSRRLDLGAGGTVEAQRSDSLTVAPSADGPADGAVPQTFDDVIPIPHNGRWDALPPLPGGPRQETAVVSLGTRIYVIGGFSGAPRVVGTVEIYDTSTGVWSTAAPLPVGLHHANAAVIGERIYLVGFSTGFDFLADGRGFIYDPAADAWTEGPAMPPGEARGASVTVARGAHLYLAGGLVGEGAVDTFSVLDTKTGIWRSLAPLRERRDHGGGAFVGDRLYLVGGRKKIIERHTAAVDVYDPATDTWSDGPAMRTSRGGFALAPTPRGFFVIGGEGSDYDDSRVFDQVEFFDGVGWRTLAPMLTPRHGTGAVFLGGLVYVPGGAIHQGYLAVDTFEVFTPPPSL